MSTNSSPERIIAPFTLALCEVLNRFQHNGNHHPFTCGGNRTDEKHLDNEGILVATIWGWVCPFCDYKQNWAHGWMAKEVVSPTLPLNLYKPSPRAAIDECIVCGKPQSADCGHDRMNFQPQPCGMPGHDSDCSCQDRGGQTTPSVHDNSTYDETLIHGGPVGGLVPPPPRSGTVKAASLLCETREHIGHSPCDFCQMQIDACFLPSAASLPAGDTTMCTAEATRTTHFVKSSASDDACTCKARVRVNKVWHADDDCLVHGHGTNPELTAELHGEAAPSAPPTPLCYCGLTQDDPEHMRYGADFDNPLKHRFEEQYPSAPPADELIDKVPSNSLPDAKTQKQAEIFMTLYEYWRGSGKFDANARLALLLTNVKTEALEIAIKEFVELPHRTWTSEQIVVWLRVFTISKNG